jgi:hypothetical protein
LPHIDGHDAIKHAARAIDRFTPTQGVLLWEALPRTVMMASMRPLLASATRLVVPITMTASRGAKPNASQMLSAASCRPVSPAVLTVKMRRPRKGRRSAAALTAASAAAKEPFCSDTPRPRT